MGRSHMNVVTVFGASGFIGRYVVREIAKTGARVRAAVRRPERAMFLKPMGDVGQVVPVAANIRDDASVAAAVDGADTVINLVGILQTNGPQNFVSLQEEGQPGCGGGKISWCRFLRADLSDRRRHRFRFGLRID